MSAGLFTGMFMLQSFGIVINRKIITESCQGDYVNYDSYDPYCLRIIKLRRVLDSEYVILISRKDDLHYGYVLSYINPSPVSENDIKQTRVIWTIEGIEMTFISGHKLYIPKDSFTAGR